MSMTTSFARAMAGLSPNPMAHLAFWSSVRAQHPALHLCEMSRAMSTTSSRRAGESEADERRYLPPRAGDVSEEVDRGKDLISTHFELGRYRRVTVSEWNGKPQIGVREWYPNLYTGELRPGPKGVALSLEEWKSLMEAAPQINKLVDGKQAELERRDENVQATVQERETEKTNHKLGRHTSDQSAS